MELLVPKLFFFLMKVLFVNHFIGDLKMFNERGTLSILRQVVALYNPFLVSYVARTILRFTLHLFLPQSFPFVFSGL